MHPQNNYRVLHRPGHPCVLPLHPLWYTLRGRVDNPWPHRTQRPIYSLRALPEGMVPSCPPCVACPGIALPPALLPNIPLSHPLWHNPTLSLLGNSIPSALNSFSLRRDSYLKALHLQLLLELVYPNTEIAQWESKALCEHNSGMRSWNGWRRSPRQKERGPKMRSG